MKKNSKEQNTLQRIVLLDANQMQLTTLGHLLQDFKNCKIVGAFQSGCRALHFLKDAANVDVLIVGCFLQDMDTIRFLDLLQQEELAHQCHVVLTGPARYMQMVSCGHLSNTVDYYMIEPYNPDDLLKCLEMFTPAQCLPKTTQWDKAIYQALSNLDISDKGIGYWYVGACLQMWLLTWYNGEIPQMKSVLMEVSRFYHGSPKGVESGVYRVMAQLKQKQAIPPDCIKAKAFFGWLAKQIRIECLQKGSEERYAEGFGTATV